ncbi:MAG: N-acetyltransferase [Sphingomonadales bacterium]|nr:MAG: N-acetyltransferase [Sphingomonadales bacterium]
MRKLGQDDAAAFRAIRLEALEAHPEAFGADLQDEADRDVEWFARWITGSAVFAAFDADRMVGIAGFFKVDGRKSAHMGKLIAMYVRPEARGSGAALDLVEAVLAHAEGQVIQVHLGVAVGNAPAIRLYEKAGFEIYGTEPRALFVNGRYIDEHLMVRFLNKAPGKTTKND